VVDAPGVTTCSGNRPKAGETSLIETDILVEFTLHTNSYIRHVIGNPQEGTFEYLKKLRLVHRASMDKVLHGNDFVHRTGGKGGEEPGFFPVDIPENFLKVKRVLHAVDPTDGGTGSISDERLRALANPPNPFNVMWSGDTPLNNGDIIYPIPTLAHGFPELHKIQKPEKFKECFPKVSYLKLTSLTASKIEKSNLWRLHHIAPVRSLIFS
jgi:hypothetical protein